MTTFDLLDTVLPPHGWFAVLGIKGKSIKQELVQTREEVDEVVQRFVESKRNVFFGCAKYETGDSRKKDNVLSVKSFWLDIDCGEDKKEINPVTNRPFGYVDQSTGMQELRRFCELIGLPKPVVVDSGRGLHVYWVLTEAVTRKEWEPVAARLNELCITHKFYVDSNVFDATRVLRVPSTFNFKQDPPLPVSILIKGGKEIALPALRTLLGVKELSVFSTPAPSFVPNEVTLAIMGNTVQKFKNIMIRGEDGCKQLNYVYENQEIVPEPLWWSALTVANTCTDRISAIHKMSEKHPDYDPTATERKAGQGGSGAGPHRCVTFEKTNPGGCDGCKWKGKIVGPIALSKEVVVAEEVVIDGEIFVECRDEELDNELDTRHLIPQCPFPFQRPANGGIYLAAGKDDAEPVCVYEHDLYVVKCMKDPESGHVALLRLHLPMDGIVEFVVPQAVIAVKEELRKVLAKNGVAGTAAQMNHLASFVLLSVKALQYKRKAETMRTQFGWVEGDTKFIIGDREISKDGIYGSPPSTATKAIVPHLQPKGTLEGWKEVFNLYARKGLEPNAFAALTAFGAPLFKFSGQKGSIINIIFKHGGSGKSTALFMCNSVYGHPTALGSIWKDTNNAKMQRLGVMNNLPYTVDEITNISADDFSDLAYGMSQGRGKDRMKGASNELRDNSTTWATMSLASANASFYEKLAGAKAGANAEMLRLFEYEIAPSNVIPVAEAKQKFDHDLLENYGHAGDIYMQYIVNNKDQCLEDFIKVQSKIDGRLRLTAPERFWSATAAANLTGGLIARRLGLINFDMAAIYDWVCDTILAMREEIKPPVDDSAGSLGDFINRHMQNILVVDANIDNRSSKAALPTLEPRGQLLIRYEPDTKHMFIVTREFRSDCVERQINYKSILAELKLKGFYKESVNKRMSKGMKISSPAVSTLMFDCTNKSFLNMDGLISSELENASRDD